MKLVLFGKDLPVPKDEPGILNGYFNTTPDWLQFTANANLFQFFNNFSLLDDYSNEVENLKELTRHNADHNKNMSEIDVNHLLYNLVRHIKPKKIVEVGVFIGSASCHMAAAQRTYMEKTAICLVDHKQENLDRALGNLAKYGLAGNIESYSGDSATVAKSGKVKKSDLIFIDGDHTLKGVMRDVNAYWDLLELNGIMVLHDSVTWNGVRTVANNLSKSENPVFTFATSMGSGISIIVKKINKPF